VCILAIPKYNWNDGLDDYGYADKIKGISFRRLILKRKLVNEFQGYAFLCSQIILLLRYVSNKY
jgi:hypothetical protein